MAKAKAKPENAESEAGEVAEVELIALVRDEPAFPGGPTEMLSHPDELENNLAIGWKIAKEK